MGCTDNPQVNTIEKTKLTEPLSKSPTYSVGDKPNNSDLFNLRNRALMKHNELRKKHNSPELKLNDKLNEMAQQYAKQLLENENGKNFVVKTFENGICGENILLSKNKTPEEMCDKWYKEANSFDFSSFKYQKDSGHFTQMIWKETKQVGFGFEYEGDGNFCGVALYYPAGNIFGKFEKNVQAAK